MGVQGGIYDSYILNSDMHAFTILYPSIECNLGGDIEGRRAEREREMMATPKRPYCIAMANHVC